MGVTFFIKIILLHITLIYLKKIILMIFCKGRFCFLFVFLFLTLSRTLGQDPHFSQFYANPLYLNPALTGTATCSRFSLNFRDQWPSFPGNFVTFSGSYDQHISKLHGGVGVLFSGDIAAAGIYQTYIAGAIYNFRVQATHRFFLQFALQGNYLFSSLNWTKLRLASQILNTGVPVDLPQNQNNHLSKSQFDLGFGFVGYTPYIYFGLAVHHLLPLQMNFFRGSNNNFDKIWEPKWTAHVGGKITIIQKLKSGTNFGDIFFHPNIVFITQGKFHYLHEGFYFNFYPLTIGAWLRHNFKSFDAIIVSCGVEYKIFRIGYSYDFNLTKLERTGGAHEVSLQFILPCDTDKKENSPKKKNRKYPQVPCPCL
jgi:type IX secretion system PorP/SprF family membrane protein